MATIDKIDVNGTVYDISVHGLHIGSKYFDGSASTTISASDLNAPTKDEVNSAFAKKSDIPTALPDVHSLYIGNSTKYFNGSTPVTIYASDLGAVTYKDTDIVKTDYISYNSDTMNGVRLTTNNGVAWYSQFAAGIVDFPAGSNNRSKSVSFSGSGGNPFYGTAGTVKVVVSEVAKDGYSGSGTGEWYNAVKAYGVSNSGFTIYCAPGDAVSVNWIAFKLS